MIKSRHKKFFITSFVIFLILTLLGYGTFQITKSRSFQFFGGIINHVETEQKVIALTFDDGPTDKTDTILSILKEEDIKATFFLIGSDIEKFPEEAKAIVKAGHQVGNHTYSHNRMVLKSYGYIKNEIESTDQLIRNLGYQDTIQFRPPNGKKLLALPYYLKQNHRKTILWDLEPNSYPEVNASSEAIVKYVLDNAKPGSIILLHTMYDNKGTTINALSGIIKGMKEKGYTFKTVNELLSIETK